MKKGIIAATVISIFAVHILACQEETPEGVYRCVNQCPQAAGGEITYRTVCAKDEYEATNMCNFYNPASTPPDPLVVGNCTLSPTPCYRQVGNYFCTCSVVFASERSCSSPCGGGPLADLTGDLKVEIIPDPYLSYINYYQDDEYVGYMTPTGHIYFKGGNCPGGSCAIQLVGIDIKGIETVTDPDGKVYTNTSVMNVNKPATMIHDSVIETFAPHELTVTVSYDKDGSRKVATFLNYEPIGATIDVETGEFSTMFTLVNAYGGKMRVVLAGNVVNRSPVANAGPDQTIDCNATVHLDGSATIDPDGADDIVIYWWFKDYGTQNGSFIGSGVAVDAQLPIGTHEITLVVRDSAGSTSTDTTIVTVGDLSPPVIDSIEVTPDCLWPPNHKYVRFDLGENIQVAAHDECDPTPPTVEIVSVSSSEPDNDTGVGDGNTTNDVIFGPNAVCLRSERQGNGRGRVYKIGVRLTDSAGNSTVSTANVRVPHDQRPSERCTTLDFWQFIEDDDPRCSAADLGTPVGKGGNSRSGGCLSCSAPGSDKGGRAALPIVLFVLLIIGFGASRRRFRDQNRRR